MSTPIHLLSLREITDGHPETEELLLEEFASASEELVTGLVKSFAQNDNELWRSEAQALKGLASSLGAISLSSVCKRAIDHYKANQDIKLEVLMCIQAEQMCVIKFLRNLAMR